MNRDCQNIGVRIEDALRPIAVMNVKVNNRNTLHAVVGTGPLNGDSDIGEEAIPHSLISNGVVPWGSDESVGVSNIAAKNCLRRGNSASGSQSGDFQSLVPKRRPAITRVTHHQLTLSGEIGEVTLGMHSEYVVIGGNLRIYPMKLCDQATHFNKAMKPRF
jgi:putative hemolysin